MSNCHVYEIFSQTYSLLHPRSQPNHVGEKLLTIQKIIWAPTRKLEKSRAIADDHILVNPQAISFVYSDDIYYKHDIRDETTVRLTKNGKI